jgi:hypothetical protein
MPDRKRQAMCSQRTIEFKAPHGRLDNGSLSVGFN